MGAADGLADAVRSALEARGVSDATTRIEPILNWGGFVNRSFRISTDAAEYCLKLTSDIDAQRGLRQWQSLHVLLEDRYHAPRVLEWIDIEGTGFSGPLFEWVPGRTPETHSEPAITVLSDLLTALHRDADLAGRLEHHGHGVRSCGEIFRATFHRRFTEDLEAIRAARPPFVTGPRLQWMHDEVRALEKQVAEAAAFGEPAAAPTHGDVWLNNILVTETGSVYLLDWDGLAPGDPVMDWAMLYGPCRQDLRPATVRAPSLGSRFAPREQERLAIWARATSLDWVIDPLADWVSAESEPEHGPVVRAANERLHEHAVSRYRALPGVRPAPD